MARRMGKADSMKERTRDRQALDRRVGFYGCSGKLIRLECVKPDERQYPRRVRLKCPGCGHTHDAGPSWRKWREDLDAGVAPDHVVVLDD